MEIRIEIGATATAADMDGDPWVWKRREIMAVGRRVPSKRLWLSLHLVIIIIIMNLF